MIPILFDSLVEALKKDHQIHKVLIGYLDLDDFEKILKIIDLEIPTDLLFHFCFFSFSRKYGNDNYFELLSKFMEKFPNFAKIKELPLFYNFLSEEHEKWKQNQKE